MSPDTQRDVALRFLSPVRSLAEHYKSSFRGLFGLILASHLGCGDACEEGRQGTSNGIARPDITKFASKVCDAGTEGTTDPTSTSTAEETDGVECMNDLDCEGDEVCEEGVCEEMPAPLISPIIVNCLIDPNEPCTSNAESPTKVTYTIKNAKKEDCEASVKVVDGPDVSNDGFIENFSLTDLDYYGGGPFGVTERITVSCDNGWKIASSSVDVYLSS